MPYGTEEAYRVGRLFSTFDVDGDGFVENPPVVDPLDPDTLINTAAVREYGPLHLQVHTLLHEIGHAVGAPAVHSADATDLMYQESPDWDRGGHFSPGTRATLLIHNRDGDPAQ